MEKTLQRLGEVDIIPPPGPSKFVAPQTVMYHLDGDSPIMMYNQRCLLPSPAKQCVSPDGVLYHASSKEGQSFIEEKCPLAPKAKRLTMSLSDAWHIWLMSVDDKECALRCWCMLQEGRGDGTW